MAIEVGDPINYAGKRIGTYSAKYGNGVRYLTWRCDICLNGAEPGGHYGANGGGAADDCKKHYKECHQAKTEAQE